MKHDELSKPWKKVIFIGIRNPPMLKMKSTSVGLTTVSLAGWPWLWRGVSLDDAARVDCLREIAVKCGVWLSGVHDDEGSWVNAASFPILGNEEKGCKPLRCCGLRE